MFGWNIFRGWYIGWEDFNWLSMKFIIRILTQRNFKILWIFVRYFLNTNRMNFNFYLLIRNFKIHSLLYPLSLNSLLLQVHHHSPPTTWMLLVINCTSTIGYRPSITVHRPSSSSCRLPSIDHCLPTLACHSLPTTHHLLPPFATCFSLPTACRHPTPISCHSLLVNYRPLPC